MANLIVMKLLYLQSENRHQDIHLYINSPGGSVSATLAIYDTMQYLEPEVNCYCIGLAASGAAVLMAGGAKGKRYILPHAKMMIHQPYGPGGQVSDIEIQAKEILQTREVLNKILADHTGQPIERIARKRSAIVTSRPRNPRNRPCGRSRVSEEIETQGRPTAQKRRSKSGTRRLRGCPPAARFRFLSARTAFEVRDFPMNSIPHCFCLTRPP